MSVASGVTSISSQPLAEKYAKVAREYAKLKKQVDVLKDAVRDERAQRENLFASSQQQDRQSRIFESEIESLRFRNNQLTKRVEQLQTLLDAKDASKAQKNKPLPKSQSSYDAHQNGSTMPIFPAVDVTVLMEDLRHKMTENERLHNRMHEMSTSHEREMAALIERLQMLESRSEQSSSSLNDDSIGGGGHSSHNNSKFPKSVELNPFDDDDDYVTACENDVKHQTPKMSPQDQKHIGDNLRRTCDQLMQCCRNHCVYIQQLVDADASDGDELSQSLRRYSSAIQMCSKDIHDVFDKLSEGKMQNTLFTKSVNLAFQPLLQSSALVSKFLQDWLSVQNNGATKDEQDANNQWLRASHSVFHVSLESLSKHFYDWTPSSLDEKYRLLKSWTEGFIQKLADLSNAFDKKLLLQKRQNLTTKQRAQNECLSACYTSFKKQTNDFHRILSDDSMVDFLKAAIDFDAGDAAKNSFTNQATPKPATTSIETLALDKLKQDIVRLNEQLITQTGRVNHLEQEREQQLLELNLLRMKLENATEKANTENHETSTSKSDNSHAVIDEQQFAQAFYAERLQAARRELDDSHTCVIYWQRECEELLRLVDQLEKQMSDNSNELVACRRKEQKLCDDLETTRTSYEEQMRSLSEHIAELNSKLTESGDQVEAMKTNRQNDKKASRNYSGFFKKIC